MRLRRLELGDAARMLEWMQDAGIIKNMHTDFQSKTIQECKEFIRFSWESTEKNLHLAVTDEENVYMGTVSLKNINKEKRYAEFAIVMHCSAIGKGIALQAMNQILMLGSIEYGLKNIYWCVARDNIRAIRFYDKNNFFRTDEVPDYLTQPYSNVVNFSLLWYVWKM